MDRCLDFQTLRAAASRISAWLAASGVPPGARVAIVQRDGPWAAVMLVGLCHAHAAVPLNPNLTTDDYAFAIADFAVSAVVIEEGVLDDNRRAAIGVRQLTFTPWSVPAGEEAAPVAAAPDAAAFLLHTSGTTARPKKVVLSQRRIFCSASVIADALRLGPHDRCLTGMPMFHVHGILNALASTLVSGGSFLHCGPFDTLAMYDHLRTLEPTWITAVPTMYHALAARPELAPRQHRLRFLRSSSAPLSDVLSERLEQLFGVPVLSSYGMTEIDPIACMRLGEKAPRGAVGRSADLELRLADPMGEEAPDAASGEVWVRGTRVIDGYEAEPEVNAAAFRDGWFRTGDVARRDVDGWLYLSGRIKEIINRAGEKVAPLEIDAVLLRHPDVVEAAAFAVLDPVRGEEIAAAVVLRSGATLSVHDLRQWLSQRLAFHKCPRYVQFVAALPKGPTGKLLRNALRLGPEQAAAADDAMLALVCSVWAEVLRLESASPQARFLDLGGSSEAAFEILDRLSRRLARPLPIDVLFDGDTPTAMAGALHRVVGFDADQWPR